jgi:hypothetical protein
MYPMSSSAGGPGVLKLLCAPALCLALAAAGAPGAEIEIEEGVKPLPEADGVAAAEPADPADPAEPDPAGAGPAGEKEQREYGYLGVTLEAVPAEVAEHLGLDADGRGLVVDQVQKSSPAAEAGLLSEDILVRVDDQVIYSLEQLQKLVASKKPGTEVTVGWIRRGREGSTKVKLGSTTEPAWRAQPAGPADAWQLFRGHGPWGDPGRGGGKRPPAILRWRVPGTGEWKSITPDTENWREEIEKLLEGLRSDLPEDVMKKFREEIEKRGQQAQDAAKRARAGAAAELSLNPAQALQVPGPGDPEVSTSTTVTAEQGGYRDGPQDRRRRLGAHPDQEVKAQREISASPLSGEGRGRRRRGRGAQRAVCSRDTVLGRLRGTGGSFLAAVGIVAPSIESERQ